MNKKIKCALIGPGNIGTDLLYKLMLSDALATEFLALTLPTSLPL